MRGPCRFKEMAVSGRVYRKYSREEILRTWGRFGDTVCQGVRIRKSFVSCDFKRIRFETFQKVSSHTVMLITLTMDMFSSD